MNCCQQYYLNRDGQKGIVGLISIQDGMIIQGIFQGKCQGLAKSHGLVKSRVHVGIYKKEMELE